MIAWLFAFVACVCRYFFFFFLKAHVQLLPDSVNRSRETSLTPMPPRDENKKFSTRRTLRVQICGNCFLPSFGLGQGSRTV